MAWFGPSIEERKAEREALRLIEGIASRGMLWPRIGWPIEYTRGDGVWAAAACEGRPGNGFKVLANGFGVTRHDAIEDLIEQLEKLMPNDPTTK